LFYYNHLGKRVEGIAELGKAILFGAPTGAFVGFVIGLMLPVKKVKAFGITYGSLASKLGRGKIGKAVWEPVETRIEQRLRALVEGLIEGANKDDKF
jgi:hypothetical protein